MKICGCPSVFSFASPKEKTGKRKRARGDFDFPPESLEPTPFSWIFPAKFEKLLKISGISRKSFVGVDAHIDPADCTVFTEIYGEFVTAQRADVGIGRYRTLANPYCLATFERKADLSQIF